MKRIWVSLGVVLAIGCGGGESTDAGMGGDAPISNEDTGGGGTDAGRDAPVPVGDGNDTFATATPLVLGAASGGDIGTEDDLDYYSFEAVAGDWMQFTTNANPDDDPMMIDTVITIYDSTFTQIAENDDSLPRTNTDSEVTFLVPATGTYYVLVQEFTTWMGMPGEFGATYTYQLLGGVLNTTADFITLDAEAGDTAADAQALNLIMPTGATNLFGQVLGTFDDATDVDVYSFTIPDGDPANLNVDVMPAGPTGNGSTITPSRIWVTNADGSEIIARITPETAPAAGTYSSVEPSLPSGDYLLFIENAGPVGANDFYVLKVFQLGDNPPEALETENDSATTPEELVFNDLMAGGRGGFVLATLGDGDTDYYSATVLAGDLSVACGSATSGSGVQGLTVTLLEMDGTTEIASATETATTAPFIMPRAVAAGTYLIRLTKTGQDAEVTGNWVRCGVRIAPPAP